jgi:hypothetical protein
MAGGGTRGSTDVASKLPCTVRHNSRSGRLASAADLYLAKDLGSAARRFIPSDSMREGIRPDLGRIGPVSASSIDTPMG